MNNELGELSEILNKLGSSGRISDFLDSLLTPAEKKDIEKRWKLVKMLHEGKTQRKIASELGISLCKITRGARELKKEGSIFKKVLEGF